jgi:hypothetical protein
VAVNMGIYRTAEENEHVRLRDLLGKRS